SDPEGRYGVVLADMGRDRELLELLLRREFDCLTQDYESLPVNFSTGFSLEAAPLVRDGLTLLALCAEQVAVEDLGLPFHSRFVTPLPLRRDRLEKFLQRLHELNRDRIPRAVFLQLAEGLLEQTDSAPWESAAQLDVRMHLSRRRRAPSQWLEPFAALLDIWGWPRGRALDSLEYQQLQHWQTALESYARLDPILGELSFEQALQSLRGHIAEQQFQPHTQDRAIQILGPLETTGLHFDALWISGMDASRWPSAPRPNPYLPHSIQRQQRMPHCDAPWEWEWARNRWELWRSSALQLHSSYVNQSDGAESARSPLLGDMDAEDSDSVYQVDPRWQQQGDSAVFVEPRLLAVPIQEQERASDGVSASALDQQSQCPFQAFAAQRLRVQAPSTTTAGLTPAERGTWLHSALFCLFADLPDSAALALDNAPAIAAAIERALQEAESGLGALRRDVLGTAIVALERRRLENLLKEWLDIERSRGEPFLVVRREWARELLIGPLRLRLRLDRVDRMADGSELVIDYKSGVADSPGRWFESPPRKLQLPLYALLEPPPAGISYASLKPGKLGFRGVGERSFTAGVDDISSHSPDGSGGAAGMNTVRAFWRAELSTLAEHFVAGENQVDPLVGACRYCGRQSLCRVGDGQQ
ncbi:MAG: ATP-dependent helicase/nuclease subunit B, partial [Halieaceae bacterium]